MAHRLMILMVLGLGAMYMLHLLAQDWNTIQRPAKRSITRLLTAVASTNFNNSIIRTKRHHYSSIGTQQPTGTIAKHNMTVDWKRILSRDPFQCLESLICQLVSGAERTSLDAIVLCDFLEANMEMVPAIIGRAYLRGLALRGSTQRCFDEYPMCWYSAKTMLKILKWFAAPTDE